MEEKAITDRPTSMLENALADLESRRGILTEQLHTLANRLESVLKLKYDGEANAKAIETATKASEPTRSPIVERINYNVSKLRELEDIAGHLLKHLEV